MTQQATPAEYLDQILARVKDMNGPDRAALAAMVDKATLDVWVPNPGPQHLAYLCEADELFYGGMAGSGKTSLLFGLALTAHKRSLILRRTNREASKLVDGIADILGNRDGFNGRDNVWRLPDERMIDLGGCQLEEDRQKYKGVARDLIAFDEIADFSESQFRFISAWNRSTDQAQRSRIVAAGNPPTRPEGLWVIKYWAPWFDPKHPRPAKSGELRWFTTIDGKECEVDGPGPYQTGSLQVRARSRTFIRGELTDNPDLLKSGYSSLLAALPDELRAAYFEGRFDAALKDDEFQVIPTAWVDAAMARWREDGHGNRAERVTSCQ